MRQDLNSGNPFETDEFCVFLVRSVSLTPKGVVSESTEPVPMSTLLVTRTEEGSTEQSIETPGFPENSVNRVVRHLTEILAQGNSTLLLSCVFCNVGVFTSLLLWIGQQSARPPAGSSAESLRRVRIRNPPEPPLSQADGHSGVGAAGGHRMYQPDRNVECASVCWTSFVICLG